MTFEAFDSGTRDARAYRDACLAVLAKPRKPDLAFVITSEDQEDLTGDDSPYLVAKSAFMSQGVPVQDVQIETMRKDDLAYPLNSIALACYAKLGGTPYVIAAPRAVTQELVIGIGSAHDARTLQVVRAEAGRRVAKVVRSRAMAGDDGGPSVQVNVAHKRSPEALPRHPAQV